MESGLTPDSRPASSLSASRRSGSYGSGSVTAFKIPENPVLPLFTQMNVRGKDSWKEAARYDHMHYALLSEGKK